MTERLCDSVASAGVHKRCHSSRLAQITAAAAAGTMPLPLPGRLPLRLRAPRALDIQLDRANYYRTELAREPPAEA